MGISPSQGPLPTHDNANRVNADTSMPRMGFEPTISVFERENKFYDLDRAATVIGRGNRTTRRKPTPLPLCSPQVPHDLT
jgi:hypothetical protein